MNRNTYFIFFAVSGVHPIIIPPLLSTEAPDATGPSLFGGRYSPPGRRVSGLGGPELMRPMLLLQPQKWSSRHSEMMAMRFAEFSRDSVQLRKWWWLKPNHIWIRWNQQLCHRMNCQKLLPQPKLTHQKTASDFTWVFPFLLQGSRKYQTPQLKDL